MYEPACPSCGSNTVYEVTVVYEYHSIQEVHQNGVPARYGDIGDSVMDHVAGYHCDNCGELASITSQEQYEMEHSLNGQPEEIENV